MASILTNHTIIPIVLVSFTIMSQQQQPVQQKQQQSRQEEGNDNDEIFDDMQTAITALHESSIAIPCDLPAHLHRQLQSEDPQNAILHIAQFFRNQSQLMLRQAAILEQMALERDSHTPELYPLEDYLNGTALTTIVAKATTLMQATQDQLDQIESKLHPWEEAITKRTTTTSKKGRDNAYSMFCKDNYAICSQQLGSRGTAVIQELGNIWKGLADERKKEYRQKAEEANRKRRLEEDAHQVSAKRQNRTK
jgi:HMG (high mobility group) box